MKQIVSILTVLSLSYLSLGGQVVVIDKNSLSDLGPDVDSIVDASNKTLRFEFETLYFVNRQLIDDYLDVVDENKELRIIADSLINFTERYYKSLEEDFNLLYKNMDKSYKVISDSLMTNNERLDRWKRENSSLIEANRSLGIKLTEAEKDLKNERWKSMGSKLLFGGGGVLVGVGLSAIIVLVSK